MTATRTTVETKRVTLYRCEGCGELFDEELFGHPVHARDCNGECRNCPQQCGPISLWQEYDGAALAAEADKDKDKGEESGQ